MKALKYGLVPLAFTMSLLSSTVAAQVTINGPTDTINLQNFQPTPSPFGLFMVEGSRSLRHLEVAGGLVLNLSTDTLNAVGDDGTSQVVIESQTMADLLLSVGLFDWLEVNLALPIALTNDIAATNIDAAGTALGDLSLKPRVTLLDSRHSAVGLALFTHFVLPTSDEPLISGDKFALRPGAAIDTRPLPNVNIALNAAVEFAEERQLGALSVGNRLLYGAGVEVDVLPNFMSAGVELNGSTALADPFVELSSPLEAVGGVKFRVTSNLQIEAGAGRGIVGGAGTPALRVFAGIRYAPFYDKVTETVDDIMAGINYIPTEREWRRLGPSAAIELRARAMSSKAPPVVRLRSVSSLRHFPTDDTKAFLIAIVPDSTLSVTFRRKAMLTLALAFGVRWGEDGVCGQRDEDSDVLQALKKELNAEDPWLRESAIDAISLLQTPEGVAELKSLLLSSTDEKERAHLDEASRLSFTQRGCPDSDGDGLDNNTDKCPEALEDKDGFEDGDGCPELDNDGDGFEDSLDECPDEEGHPALKGCPDNDNDKDQVENDQCPAEAEDMDGFQDDDGCPDLDNDKDGIPDLKDKCPNEAETHNGRNDEDGCPDKGEVLVTKDLKINDRVFFDEGRAKIKRRSFKLLDAVARVIKGHPEITMIEIQGHTDDLGKAATNKKLSEDRAKAVMQYIVSKGIKPERLSAKGYGSTEPSVQIDGLKGRKLKAARNKNRRVQFEVLKRKRD